MIDPFFIELSLVATAVRTRIGITPVALVAGARFAGGAAWACVVAACSARAVPIAWNRTSMASAGRRGKGFAYILSARSMAALPATTLCRSTQRTAFKAESASRPSSARIAAALMNDDYTNPHWAGCCAGGRTGWQCSRRFATVGAGLGDMVRERTRFATLEEAILPAWPVSLTRSMPALHLPLDYRAASTQLDNSKHNVELLIVGAKRANFVS